MIWWQDLYSWNVEKGGNTMLCNKTVLKYKHEIHTSYNLLTTNFCPVLFTPSMATNWKGKNTFLFYTCSNFIQSRKL